MIELITTILVCFVLGVLLGWYVWRRDRHRFNGSKYK